MQAQGNSILVTNNMLPSCIKTSAQHKCAFAKVQLNETVGRNQTIRSCFHAAGREGHFLQRLDCGDPGQGRHRGDHYRHCQGTVKEEVLPKAQGGTRSASHAHKIRYGG
jgi:hypothetical protein